MYDKELTKNNITAFVNAYKWAFPQEYQATIQQVKQNRSKNLTKTGDFTKMQGVSGAGGERPIHEISETLFTILHNKLDSEELGWWGTKEGARWFAKNFPEFARVEKV